MRYVRFVACLGLMLCGAATAQVSAPATVRGSDQWAAPTSADAAAAYQRTPPLPGTQTAGSFTFKPRGPQSVQGQAPGVMDSGQTGNAPLIQPDGRPALNCAQTPQDPKCH
jgi:hypothetical protein